MAFLGRRQPPLLLVPRTVSALQVPILRHLERAARLPHGKALRTLLTHNVARLKQRPLEPPGEHLLCAHLQQVRMLGHREIVVAGDFSQTRFAQLLQALLKVAGVVSVQRALLGVAPVIHHVDHAQLALGVAKRTAAAQCELVGKVCARQEQRIGDALPCQRHIMIDERQLAVIIDEYVCPMAVAVAHQEVPDGGVQVVAALHLLKELQHCLFVLGLPHVGGCHSWGSL
mmetsp:Transcript_15457/g.39276  ORF Transcript_15457/g.39276 Transcript_15457/m.39276 type:complete len:229 (+) Transcript_15457:381-1067(+)